MSAIDSARVASLARAAQDDLRPDRVSQVPVGHPCERPGDGGEGRIDQAETGRRRAVETGGRWGALEQGERSIRIDCYIWKPRAAISSHAIATEEVTANINMFVHERDTRVGPDAGGQLRAPQFPAEAALVRETIKETGARLVIADPLLAYLPAGLNGPQVRQALTPLADIAQETGLPPPGSLCSGTSPE